MIRYFVRFLLLVAFSLSSAFAGYTAVVTENLSGGYWKAVGTGSSCMLTLGMAVVGLSNPSYAGSVVVSGLDTVNKTFTAYNNGQAALPLSGSYAECVATPSGGIQPAFTGGASDPAIVGGAVTGGAGGVSGVGLSPAEYEQFSNLIVTASAPYDYVNGGAIFGTILVATVALYLLVRGLMEFYAVVKQGRRL